MRALQFAKGAISTGIETAMRALGLESSDLDAVMLAGSFGSYINPQSARVIGLVPPVPVERIKAVGNTASEGAKMALMSFREREVAWEIPGIVEYIELSGEEDFNDRFIGNLAFPPIEDLHAAQAANEAAIVEGRGEGIGERRLGGRGVVTAPVPAWPSSRAARSRSTRRRSSTVTGGTRTCTASRATCT